MRVTCNATVGEERQIDNLCQCIKLIEGADYYVKGATVYAEYDGPKERGDILVEIFRQYAFHGISVLS